jgi:hypothetical protein
LHSAFRDPIFALADKRLVGPRWRASITLELATMVDRNFRDVYEKLAELPLRRYAEVLRNKAQDITGMLGSPAYFDQYPSKRVPWIFSRTYGPIPLTATRHYDEVLYSGTSTALGAINELVDGAAAWTVNQFAGCLVKITAGPDVGQTRTIVSNTATTLTVETNWNPPGILAGEQYEILQQGFNQLATLVDPSQYLLPREGTIKTGREAAFVWCSSNAFAYVGWTYTADPEIPSPNLPPPATLSVPVNPLVAGDIFDPLLQMNGGAVIIPNIANANHRSPRVCFDLALYDKKRGRYLTDGSLPAESFVGGAFANKLVPKQTRFNVDTEIEPRLTITEVNMGPVLDAVKAYDAASVAVYVNVAFIGYNVLEEKYNEADTFAPIPSRG